MVMIFAGHGDAGQSLHATTADRYDVHGGKSFGVAAGVTATFRAPPRRLLLASPEPSGTAFDEGVSSNCAPITCASVDDLTPDFGRMRHGEETANTLELSAAHRLDSGPVKRPGEEKLAQQART